MASPTRPQWRVAWVVFVKTPGISASKTRLAKTIGRKKADDFYLWSVRETQKHIADLAKTFPSVTPIWAVAEKAGLEHDLWKDWIRMEQGEGSLGERIHNVYSKLIKNYDKVVLYGADSPHVRAMDLKDVLQFNREKPFAIGPTTDGGFYVFAGQNKIDRDIWTTVPWSHECTCDTLLQKLGGEDKVQKLQTRFDIDEAQDFNRLLDEYPPAREYFLRF